MYHNKIIYQNPASFYKYVNHLKKEALKFKKLIAVIVKN